MLFDKFFGGIDKIYDIIQVAVRPPLSGARVCSDIQGEYRGQGKGVDTKGEYRQLQAITRGREREREREREIERGGRKGGREGEGGKEGGREGGRERGDGVNMYSLCSWGVLLRNFSQSSSNRS